MDDLIRRQAILDMLEDINNHIIDGYGYKHDWCVEWVKGLPSIDAVPVRCGECKHYWQTKRGQFVYFEECILDKLQNPSEDDFCSYGERK